MNLPEIAHSILSPWVHAFVAPARFENAPNPVQRLLSNEIASPMVVGFLSPTVVPEPLLNDLTPEEPGALYRSARRCEVVCQSDCVRHKSFDP